MNADILEPQSKKLFEEMSKHVPEKYEETGSL